MSWCGWWGGRVHTIIIIDQGHHIPILVLPSELSAHSHHSLTHSASSMRLNHIFIHQGEIRPNSVFVIVNNNLIIATTTKTAEAHSIIMPTNQGDRLIPSRPNNINAPQSNMDQINTYLYKMSLVVVVVVVKEEFLSPQKTQLI